MQADKIKLLPAQSNGVDFDQYSGYVTVDPKSGRSLFYYFAESPQNSSTNPSLLWLDGGIYVHINPNYCPFKFIFTGFFYIIIFLYKLGHNDIGQLKTLLEKCFELLLTGPGCSSLAYGAVTESGSFTMNKDGKRFSETIMHGIMGIKLYGCLHLIYIFFSFVIYN